MTELAGDGFLGGPPGDCERRRGFGTLRGRACSRIKFHLTLELDEIIGHFGANAVAVFGPIIPGSDLLLRNVHEVLSDKRDSMAMLLNTPGGVVEIVERMVTVMRQAYESVTVLVPDRAMSAGTILALSADHIFMDYFSRLGPIDPQVGKGGKLVPALSFIRQFGRLNQKAAQGYLTAVEYAPLSKFGPGELHQLEQAREFSVELLIKWLSRYKFKDWRRIESRGGAVTSDMREKRAKEIADRLSDTERWHSHGRAIDMVTLQDEVGLKTDDLAALPADIMQCVRDYFELLKDYIAAETIAGVYSLQGVFLIMTRSRCSR